MNAVMSEHLQYNSASYNSLTSKTFFGIRGRQDGTTPILQNVYSDSVSDFSCCMTRTTLRMYNYLLVGHLHESASLAQKAIATHKLSSGAFYKNQNRVLFTGDSSPPYNRQFWEEKWWHDTMEQGERNVKTAQNFHLIQ